jgi:hypothetical protein
VGNLRLRWLLSFFHILHGVYTYFMAYTHTHILHKVYTYTHTSWRIHIHTYFITYTHTHILHGVYTYTHTSWRIHIHTDALVLLCTSLNLLRELSVPDLLAPQTLPHTLKDTYTQLHTHTHLRLRSAVFLPQSVGRPRCGRSARTPAPPRTATTEGAKVRAFTACATLFSSFLF